MSPLRSMAEAMTSTLVSRQVRECLRTEDGYIDEDSCDVPFWYTRTGVIVKWSLFLGLTVIFGLYLLLGYMHAKKRMQKGLPPLRYHRVCLPFDFPATDPDSTDRPQWLVTRAELARVDPRYQNPQAEFQSYQPNNQYYGMQTMPPPPVYDPSSARPPMYEGPPPEGSTKADPSQPTWRAEPTRRPDTEDYEAPPGPPPSALQS
ncbi:hypothetical protein B0T19DRAFT_39310 [Cercophora scortea]|uniref:Uncharacterized protein n=1 Tax=Cercophora scortea TaxID=314031 RepID=A0AAE0MMF8_9PEZI|nr:hypothetical protein B0T19DRAFT_39310 [Cercophora scortea]